MRIFNSMRHIETVNRRYLMNRSKCLNGWSITAVKHHQWTTPRLSSSQANSNNFWITTLIRQWKYLQYRSNRLIKKWITNQHNLQEYRINNSKQQDGRKALKTMPVVKVYRLAMNHHWNSASTNQVFMISFPRRYRIN